MLPLAGERGGLPAAAVASPAPSPPLVPGEVGRVGEGVRTPPLVGESASRLLREAAEVRGTGQATEHDRVATAGGGGAPEEEEEEEAECGGGVSGGVSGSGRGEEAEGVPNGDGGEPIRVRGGEAGQFLKDTPGGSALPVATPAAAAVAVAAAAAAPATGESGSGIGGDVGRGGVDTPPPPPSPLPLPLLPL